MKHVGNDVRSYFRIYAAANNAKLAVSATYMQCMTFQ